MLDKKIRWAIGLGLTASLAGCGFLGGEQSAKTASYTPAVIGADKATGPEADYPVVLGDAFKVDGVEYVPSNSWNYDSVGYATGEQGEGVSASHKTLPLPSYVEVTSLQSGKTVLVRVSRRGPMNNARLIALSPAAQAQLGVGEAGPVRVRRVNPPEYERAVLRSGKAGPERIDTPKSLVQVLRKKLPNVGSASLASATASQSSGPPPGSAPATAAATPKPNNNRGIQNPRPTRRVAVGPRPEASPAPSATPSPAPAVSSTPAPKAPAASTSEPAAKGRYAVQAAAFRNFTSASKLAKAINGFVKSGGGYHRVRTGPYASRGQAEAGLAKVRAAGYRDAQIVIGG
ncbi:MAG: SPOR domain-containing protein [Marinomonas sp.]